MRNSIRWRIQYLKKSTAAATLPAAIPEVPEDFQDFGEPKGQSSDKEVVDEKNEVAHVAKEPSFLAKEPAEKLSKVDSDSSVDLEEEKQESRNSTRNMTIQPRISKFFLL